MRSGYVLSAIVLAALTVGCSSGPQAAGKYNIEQENNAFGEGAEKGVLELKEDGTYTLTMGPLTLFSGNWKVEGDMVKLTNSGGSMTVDYKIDGPKLRPYKDGKEITFWRFSKS